MSPNLLPGIVSQFECLGKRVRFFVSNLADTIQNRQANGGFYEAEELMIIQGNIEPGAVFLDIGSNVGNHAIFVGTYCDPKEMILIEPNPAAIQILELNLLLNAITADVSHLGLGLSDGESRAEAAWAPNNLGGARMIAQDEGPIRLVSGDSLFADRHIDFIKIDVEGHEMAVLAGLKATIAASRPTIFIEVDNANQTAFEAWCVSHDYGVISAYRRYQVNENFLIAPNERDALDQA